MSSQSGSGSGDARHITDGISKYIQQNFTWSRLPPSVKELCGSQRETWNRHVKEYSISHQLRWSASVVRKIVTDERDYYSAVLKYSQKNLMLFPYHLSDVIIRGLRITPFRYYVEMMLETMRDEKSYDTLPNFTAADANRLLGIGRNEYIDIMNKCRSKGLQLFRKERYRVKRDVLPSQQIDIPMEYWWHVRIGFVTEEDVKNLSDDEHKTIDTIIDRNGMFAGEIDYHVIHSLVSKGLVYLDVPVAPSDRVSVPPLENFVMNRVSGDYMEAILYKVFVSLDEGSTTHQLANMLEMEPSLVQDAVSILVRLGFVKIIAVHQSIASRAPAPLTLIADGKGKGRGKGKKEKGKKGRSDSEGDGDGDGESDPSSVPMSVSASTSPSVRWHPSWISKFADSQTDDELFALTDVSASVSSSMPMSMSPHTHTLTHATDSGTGFQGGGEGEERERERDGDKRIGVIFDSTLTAFLMMGNLSQGLKNHAVTMFEVGKLTDEVLQSFIDELDSVDENLQKNNAHTHESVGEAQRYFEHALALRNCLKFIRRNASECPVAGSVECGVDMIRSESMLNLDAGTRVRILQHKYTLLLSVSPLSLENKPLLSSVPLHHGPPVMEAMSPWARLFLWYSMQCGPSAVLFSRGARVPKVPSVLSGFGRFFVCQWSKEPVAAKHSSLLQVINDCLVNSPVLVFGYSISSRNEDDCDGDGDGDSEIESEKENEKESEVLEISLPLRIPTSEEKEKDEDEEAYDLARRIQDNMELDHTLAVVKMMKLNDKWVPLDLQFGLPLSSVELSNKLLNVIKEQKLFSEEALSKHSIAVRSYSMRLLEFIQQRIDTKISKNWNIGTGAGKHAGSSTASAGYFHDTAFPSHSLKFDGTQLSQFYY